MVLSKTTNRRINAKTYDANPTVSKLITHELFQQIEKLPESPATTYLKEQFSSKFVSNETLPASVRRARAMFKWLCVERNNEATNDRLLMTHEDFNILPRVSWSLFIEKVREVISDIIGETVPEEALIGSFSGGASTSRRRTEGHPAHKYLGQADITSAARPWFELALSLMPGWDSFSDLLSIREVPGNEFFTVLKDTTIDRVACKEPDLNMFLQKGVGNYFRRRLRRAGINLNDQSRNQSLARLGSESGELATLDLSSASDSVSTSLVELLLPDLWFSYLSSLRSEVTMIDGDEHVNEMFSSMGNGFTFELQSLIFYSLARATAYFRGTRGVVSVYGDDIICPSALALDLIWILNYCGFEINSSKSFWEGPFRESCGGHYYNGRDITPFYIRKPITYLVDIIHIANSIRKWCDRDGFGILDEDLEATWMWLRDLVPEYLWGGSDYSNKHQLVTPDAPRQRLVPITSKRVLGTGGYIHWLNSTWSREGPQGVATNELPEAISTSMESNTKQKFRVRSAVHYSGSPYSSQFLTEL